MDLTWKHPFSAIVAGPSGSGKTVFVTRFLNNIDEMCDVKFKNIFWHHATGLQPPRNIYMDRIQFRSGLPNMDEFDGDVPNLIVIDDMMRESDGNVVDLFTKGSHHRNLSVFFITQNLFHQGKGQRDISLNAHYIVCFKNPRDRAQISHLARQVYPTDPRFIEESYADATSTPHGYLLLDLKQSTPDDLRFRTRVFPDDSPFNYVYQPTHRQRRRK